jgi:NO-binding membrane sensor protein with MHYT domain
MHMTGEYDWHLVVLAVVLCFFASAVAINLFHRAQATTHRARLVWLSLDAAAAGFGIWATHFVAMLAYHPGADGSYDLGHHSFSYVCHLHYRHWFSRGVA